LCRLMTGGTGDTFHGEIAEDTIYAVRELCDPQYVQVFPVSRYAHALCRS